MPPFSWLSIVHGFVFGLPTLVLLGWSLLLFWQDYLDTLIVKPGCQKVFQRRLGLWTLLAWATVLSGALCAWYVRPPLGKALWLWKAGCGVLATLLLTRITLNVRRQGNARQADPLWCRRTLQGLLAAEGGFLIAALLGALNHYFP